MKRVVLLALIFWAVPIKSQKTTTTPKEAVCIIGSHSIYTESSLEQMEQIATLLESKNYRVHRFYDPNNEWEAIKKAALNASIFIYRGHGTHLGIDGGFGGIVVDEFVSGKEISTNLTFNLSPLVIFVSACGGAGSSAGDEQDIGVDEAKTRVLYNFLQQWTEQQTLETCYSNSIYPWCTVQANESVDDERISPAFNIAISSSPDNSVHTLSTTTNGKTTTKKINRKFDYSIAYLGNPQLTLAQTLKKKSLYAKN